MVNYFPKKVDKGPNNNPLDSDLFVTAGNDKSVKLWQLSSEEGIIKLIYVVRLDEPITCMVMYWMDQYRGCILPFVDTQHFYVIQFNPKEEVVDADAGFEVESHTIIMKFPSKHQAHTILQLGLDRLVTVSVNNWEHWDMDRQKRKKLVSTTYG